MTEILGTIKRPAEDAMTLGAKGEFSPYYRFSHDGDHGDFDSAIPQKVMDVFIAATGKTLQWGNAVIADIGQNHQVLALRPTH